MFIITFIYSLFVSLKKEYTKTSKFCRFLLERCTALVVFFGRIHIHETGTEMIPLDRKYLLVQNHRSNFDPVLSWYIYRKNKLVFVTKPENLHQPIFGKIIWRLRFLPIDRSNPRNALKTINKAVQFIKSGTSSVGIYPEGTRNWGEEPLLPFHPGALKIAQMARCPMVIAVTRHTQDVARNFPKHHTDVYMDILEVIEPEVFDQKTTVEISDHIREIMIAKYTEPDPKE